LSNQQRNLLLIRPGVIFGFERIVERGRVFRAFACLGKVHHSFFEVEERYVFKGSLPGVDALTFSEIKQGSTIFDLVFRSGEQLTSSDIEELFDVKADAPLASPLLKTKRDMELRLLELNASYGARGLVLFQTIVVISSSYV
jgi:hypothetical protein